MDFKFKYRDLVRVIDTHSGYAYYCGMIEEREMNQSYLEPVYRLFGSLWFTEHQLEHTT